MNRLLFFSFFIIPSFLLAQRRDQYPILEKMNYFGTQFDDDFLFLGNRDEQYTGGLEFEYIRKIESIKEKQGILNPFKNGQRFISSSFGSYLHTPYNVSDSLIILNDRPFSSYMYLQSGYIAHSADYERRFSAEIYFGMMGGILPRKIQDAIHTIGDSPPTNGWENRIAQKRRFIPNLKFNYQNTLINITGFDFISLRWLQARTIWELQTGLYYNGISGGLLLMADNKRPIEKGKYKAIIPPNKGNDEGKKYRFRPYVTGEVRLVAQSTSLQSLPWLYSPYIVTPDLINRVVWVGEIGAMITHGRFHFAYKINSHSREFKKYQPNWHTWAGITLGWVFE